MEKYRKKPVQIDAVQLRMDNMEEVRDMMAKDGYDIKTASAPPMRAVTGLVIHTLEGDMVAGLGDWIIKGVQGEYYPCKPDIFEKTYDKVLPGDE